MLWVVKRRNIPARLVQHVVPLFFRTMKELSINADVILGGISAGSELGHYLAIHLHTAFQNNLLGFTAAGKARLGKDLLKPVAGRGILSFTS